MHLLDLLEKKFAALHTGDQPDYELMLDIVRYLCHFPDRYHHPREGVAFGLLVKYEPDEQRTDSAQMQTDQYQKDIGAHMPMQCTPKARPSSKLAKGSAKGSANSSESSAIPDWIVLS